MIYSKKNFVETLQKNVVNIYFVVVKQQNNHKIILNLFEVK